MAGARSPGRVPAGSAGSARRTPTRAGSRSRRAGLRRRPRRPAAGVTSSPPTFVMIDLACRPISRKTPPSSRKAMVRQFICSWIRDGAVWRIGALWPSRRPATTTASTPLAWISSAATYAANGVMNDSPLSSSGSVSRRRTLPTTTNTTSPTSTPPPAATTKSRARARYATVAGQRRAQGHQRGGVVEQRLALEDRDDPARQADPAPDRGRRDGVRRGDDGADREREPARTGPAPASARPRRPRAWWPRPARPTAAGSARRLALKSTSEVFSAAA